MKGLMYGLSTFYAMSLVNLGESALNFVFACGAALVIERYIKPSVRKRSERRLKNG